MPSPPDRPRLRRSLRPRPASDADGAPLLVLEDPEDLCKGVLALPQALGTLCFALLDGSRDHAALVRDWEALTGVRPGAGEIRTLLARLDGALLLEGARAETARREATAAFRRLPWRPSSHAGVCYPAEGEALCAQVAAWRAKAGVADLPRPVTAVLAPHIDPRGGGSCHGAAIEALLASPADTFVILGTAHAPLGRRFALTTHDFDTPLGPVATDRGLVERLAARGGGDLLAEERMHAGEHSVEFQAAWLRAALRERPGLRIVPVLVGSLHDRIEDGRSPMEDPEVADFVGALREISAERGEGLALVASVDLAHVGPAYGHATRPDDAQLAGVLRADRRLLAHATAVDAEAWIRFLHEERDERNVCGAAPTYVLLAALAGTGLRGRLLRHDIWEIDPESGSHVSFAAVAYGPPAQASRGTASHAPSDA